ncbi:MAG TPA: heparan-alpha-glucosaminide N-acetyltransferase domain-containing protein [Thermoanaerobaculia bacterium]|nr:heparan-alpha-glucosaminide N-acetyltransferase domain-containing protein [Thermoanaerobaculia bacterium]
MATPAREVPRLAPARRRVDSVDVLRGLVMIVMALDHTRDFFSNARFDPLDLARTTPALYLTRWITHFCAPVFVFLAGTGARLSLSRGRSPADLARFLWTRGLWLVVVEATIVSFSWSFDPGFHTIVLQVIWAIGWSMAFLALLVRLPSGVVGAIGIGIVAGHNLLDRIRPAEFGPAAWIWNVLHVPSWHPIAQPGGHAFMLVYPLIPWVGVMAAGYAFGGVYGWEPGRRKRFLLRLGAGLSLLFVALRWANVYGDPRPWAPQKTAVLTAMDFLNCEKYPPSLLYLLMTLGPAIFLLARLERPAGAVASKVVVYGRVPFFYYVLHIPLVHAMAIAALIFRYGPGVFSSGPGKPPPGGIGFGLPAVYLAWALAVAILYLPCRWFAALKARRRDAWLSYL